MRANPEIFRKAARLLEKNAFECAMHELYQLPMWCCEALERAVNQDLLPLKEYEVFRSVFNPCYEGNVDFWWPLCSFASCPETHALYQRARLIALDLAALIAEEGEFDPKEWGQ